MFFYPDMKRKIFLKIIVIAIFIVPIFSYSGCKKQEKCGCDGDQLFTLTGTFSTLSFNEDRSIVSFSAVSNPYSIYYFCNASEMANELKEFNSGDIAQISGSAYWDCNYVYQTSNSYYQTSVTKIYVIKVTEVKNNLYGK
jgi:hypothetical protein